MLTLTYGTQTLVLPTPEIEAAVERLIDTRLYGIPSELHDGWDPSWHERSINTRGLAPPPWPKPPMLKLNELYWPVTGATRFAYGYFLMEKTGYDAMAASSSDHALYASDGANTLVTPMFALAPRVLIKESSIGKPLYVVPLVDERFFWQFKAIQFTRTHTTWKQVWDAIKPSIETWRTVSVDTSANSIFTTGTDEGHFGPDKNLIVTGWNSIALVIDAMMAATGFRFVCSPGQMKISEPPSAYSSDSSDVYRLGGGTTTTRIPHSFKFRYWNGTEPINRAITSTQNKSGGLGGFNSYPEWEISIDTTLNQPDTAYSLINAYFSSIATRYFNWCKYQYDVIYSGIHQTVPHFSGTINGTIDSFLFSLGNLSKLAHTTNQLTSRVASLPPWAISRQLAVSGLERDDIHFVFQLLESLADGSAMANLTYLDGTRQFSDVVYDPTLTQMFSELEAGASGLAVAQNDLFYVYQAECEDGSSNPPIDDEEPAP